MFQDRPYEVRSDAVGAYTPVEGFKLEESRQHFIKADLIDDVKGSLLNAQATLPYFAELYNISAKLSDYVLVPVVIMPSDLPNRNRIAFPREELLRPSNQTRCLGYETWTNGITAVDHINKDYKNHSKGVIFDSYLKPIKNSVGNLLKVVCLCGFDRTRDPMLVNAILTGQRNSYSMGAMCTYYTCSICGAEHPDKGCHHVSVVSPSSTLSVFDGDKLAYLQARHFVGFEVSSVTSPAYLSAQPKNFIPLWEKAK